MSVYFYTYIVNRFHRHFSHPYDRALRGRTTDAAMLPASSGFYESITTAFSWRYRPPSETLFSRHF